MRLIVIGKNMFQTNIRCKIPLQTFAILLFLCGAAFAQERTWKTFTPAIGDWSILAPGELKSDPDGIELLGKKGGYSYVDKTGFFAVIYENSPGWAVTIYKPFMGSHFKKVRNKFVKDSKGKLLKEVKFKSGDKKGREYYVQIPDGKTLDNEGQWTERFRIARYRAFLDGNRFYTLLAVVPENEVYTPAIDKFFTSFVVNK
jgi:hypothetical protein